MSAAEGRRTPVLYLAPWIDYGGSDKNTIDWFRWIDQERFAPYLVTTQPSPNRLIPEVEPFAEEIWNLPDLMRAEDMPEFVFDLIHSRRIEVVHVMNSRMGYELLPFLGSLPRPPAVVVQLHVEEEDRSGYVRYVTTRYGNLVDLFSISNETVARAVEGYGVPRDRIRVIYTGADAESEFSPDRWAPAEELAQDRLQILFAGRLVPQKDPMLMLDVANGLRERGVGFEVQVVGEGVLQNDMERRIRSDGLGGHITLHPPTPGLQEWYSACDALLMTSTFEGIPCVVFEAMAMGLPIVAPDLPGIAELLGDFDGALVSPRDTTDGYVEALARLAEDRGFRERRGAELRSRAEEQFSVQQMADDHGRLYDELIQRRGRWPEPSPPPPMPEPIRFGERPKSGTPLVSVLTPHFNQVRFLRECVDSVLSQTYPEVEMVIVDDASSEAGVGALLEELEELERVTVVRLEDNGGPSRARNVGLESCSGRYILPLDSDNKLLPDAIQNLVEQLQAAGEEVGFIYPNLQYFGNREDYYEVPQYNVFTLLHGNFCDTCSLLDRTIFDAGERYREEIVLGHEDWDFFLGLAARGVRGEAAEGPTVLYRKWGFNRSDLVDHSGDGFEELLETNSPFRGREAEVKAKESPALSVIALGSLDETAADGLAHQSCTDVELIGAFEGELGADVPPLRRLEKPPAAGGLEALREAVGMARGAFLALAAGSGASLLADRALCEKLLRRFEVPGEVNAVDAIAFADAGEDGHFSLRALVREEAGGDAAPAHSIIWRRTVELELPHGLMVDAGDPAGSVAELFSAAGLKVEWRHAPAPAAHEEALSGGELHALPANPLTAEDPFDLRPAANALLPGAGEYEVPRWEATPSWVPALSTILTRYRERFSERRLVTNKIAPFGYDLEHHIGAMRSVSYQGTARLLEVDGEFRAIPAGEGTAPPEGAEELGYFELAGFPQTDALAIAVHRTTGQMTLVTLTDDPMLHEVDVVEALGYVEPFPARPRELPDSADRPLGLVGLTRAVDMRDRRHRYALGAIAEGELLMEVGALAPSDSHGSTGAWVVDGYLVTERHRPPRRRPGSLDAVRWVSEPATWRGIDGKAVRSKAVARRAASAAQRIARPARPAGEPQGTPHAWLFEKYRPGRAPLYAAYHPISGDQLLTKSREDVANLGYAHVELLGYVRLLAPVTGDLSPRPVNIPWARRLGAVPHFG